MKIAEALGESGTLICIDLDEGALQEARSVIEKMKGLPKVHFIKLSRGENLSGQLEIQDIDAGKWNIPGFGF